MRDPPVQATFGEAAILINKALSLSDSKRQSSK
jgi:hypothetical protein